MLTVPDTAEPTRLVQINRDQRRDRPYQQAVQHAVARSKPARHVTANGQGNDSGDQDPYACSGCQPCYWIGFGGRINGCRANGGAE
jgi:hypothetical protein